jgi:hypothetical protein
MGAPRESSSWLDDRFGVAVRTGFRRTDENTGRTIEMLLCPDRDTRDATVGDQSQAFFAELKGDNVNCGLCSRRHPVIDFFDAEKRGFIVTNNADGGDEDCINASARDVAEAIRLAARPKRATAKG